MDQYSDCCDNSSNLKVLIPSEDMDGLPFLYIYFLKMSCSCISCSREKTHVSYSKKRRMDDHECDRDTVCDELMKYPACC